MKFFIGIVPPSDISDKIFSFQKNFPSNKVPYFYEPHITLKAPSGLGEDKIWLPGILSFGENYPRFEITLNGLDMFNDKVLFLKLAHSNEIIDLHMKLVLLLNLNIETSNKFFEGSIYHPHLTLGETTWGGMTPDELVEMKGMAEVEFKDTLTFQVSFIRLYQKDSDDGLYVKLLDIPLNKP